MRLTTRLAALAVTTALGLVGAVSLTAPSADPQPVRPVRADPRAAHHDEHQASEGLSRHGMGTAGATRGAP